jgi:hypothetical protein
MLSTKLRQELLLPPQQLVKLRLRQKMLQLQLRNHHLPLLKEKLKLLRMKMQ